MMMARLHTFLHDRSGVAAAEMVLILPVALALLFATFEGAYYMICEHRVIKGVRDAARYAARLDRSLYACPAATFSGSTATIQNLARTGQLSGGSAKVSGWVDSDITVSVTCTAGVGGIYANTGNYAPLVRVRTAFNYPSLLGVLGFTTSTVRIGAAAQSPVIGI
jgi:Flp pilus assembly protein TadG